MFKNFFCPQKLKKPPEKVAYLWQLGFFFSAALPARNSPELHFCFINSSIHSSVLKSVATSYQILWDDGLLLDVTVMS